MDSAICRDVFRGDVLALQVLDREGVRTCAHEEPYAILSITDPQFKHPTLKCNGFCQAVLPLTFSDVGERTALLKKPSLYVSAFTVEMAEQVAGFVREQVCAGTLLIVIHCEAGMSRSAGVAAALSQFYNHDEAFFAVHYRPNIWVRKLVLEAMQRE